MGNNTRRGEPCQVLSEFFIEGRSAYEPKMPLAMANVYIYLFCIRLQTERLGKIWAFSGI